MSTMNIVREGNEGVGMRTETHTKATSSSRRLVDALECFRRERNVVKGPEKWATYDAWAEAARHAFDGVDESKASDSTFDYLKFMRQFAIMAYLANVKFSRHSTEEKFAVLKFLREQRANPKDVSWYLDNANRPKVRGVNVPGVGTAALFYFLMELRPDRYASWSSMAYSSLAKVGLHSGPNPTTLTLANYNDCQAKQDIVRDKMRELGIGQSAVDSSDADYITVNEFLWFVADHGRDISCGETSKVNDGDIHTTHESIGSLETFVLAFAAALERSGLTYDLTLIGRFVAALLSKPFVVLTGLSGSGKTKLAQAFTQWLVGENTCRLIPVGADWMNNEKLLGYPNALDATNYVMSDTGVLRFLMEANERPELPYFLILDEMNLSHVERYFADFLSAMESGVDIRLYDGQPRRASDGTPIPSVLTFPKNLFVIGTMNVDETTHAFSPKVLDRAQVIEFRVDERQMSSFLDAPKKPNLALLKSRGNAYAADFLRLHQTSFPLDAADRNEIAGMLKEFFPILSELGAEFAFRTAIEIFQFCGYARQAGLSVEETIDAAILQKLLPKLHGSRRRLTRSLEAFWALCLKGECAATLADFCRQGTSGAIAEVARFPGSAEKIRRMYKSAEENGYASYAEA